MNASRFLRFSVVAFALAALMVVVPAPGHASAAVPVPSVPPPVNVLPSTISSGFTGAYEYAYLFAQYAMSNNLIKGAAKTAAGAVPTVTEAQALAQAALKFKIPATAIGATLAKGVGPAALVISSAQLGLFLGNGAARIAGFNDDMVCQQDDTTGVLRSVAALTNGVDCNAFDMTQQAVQQANNDATAGTIYPSRCVGPNCVQYAGTTQYSGSTWVCFSKTGNMTGLTLRVSESGFPAFARPPFYPWTQSYLEVATPGNQQTNPGNGPGAGGCPDGSYFVGRALGGWGLPSVVDGYYLYDSTTGQGVPASEPPPFQQGTADPERRLVCTLRYSGGQTVTAQSAPFHESDGAYSPIVCPDLPEGGTFEGWDIDLKTDGLTDQRLATNDALPSYTDFTENYSECMQGVCQLDLLKNSVSCFSAPEGCADWLSDPNKESTYSCRYGDHDVALSECNLYGPTFKPSATATGQTYGDPVTGAPQSSPTSVPSDVSGYAQGVQDPEDTRQCFPTGWGVLNPVEWVTKPVQCALEWAFVPRVSVLNATTSTMTASWDSGVGDKLGEVVAPFAAIPVMTGCSGVPVDMDITWPVAWSIHWTFGYACDGPLQPLALAVRTVFSGLFVFIGLKLISGYLGGMLGFRGFGGGGAED